MVLYFVPELEFTAAWANLQYTLLKQGLASYE